MRLQTIWCRPRARSHGVRRVREKISRASQKQLPIVIIAQKFHIAPRISRRKLPQRLHRHSKHHIRLFTRPSRRPSTRSRDLNLPRLRVRPLKRLLRVHQRKIPHHRVRRRQIRVHHPLQRQPDRRRRVHALIDVSQQIHDFRDIVRMRRRERDDRARQQLFEHALQRRVVRQRERRQRALDRRALVRFGRHSFARDCDAVALDRRRGIQTDEFDARR